MKKIITVFIIPILFCLFSCKKYYNCRCNTTLIFTNSQDGYSSKNEKMKSKMTEKQATDVCKKEAKTINQTNQNLLTNNGNYSGNTIVASTVCSIE